MGFLDGSGDIVLDAVLTELGRRRLARADGSFSISRFSLADDELDYSLYNANAAMGHEDLELLKTPILEAFSDSKMSLQFPLMTLAKMDHLYLPVMKLNTTATPTYQSAGYFAVLVNEQTKNQWIENGKSTNGVIYGYSLSASTSGDGVEIHQGIAKTIGASTLGLSPSLKEDEYRLAVDRRFTRLVNINDGIEMPINYEFENIAYTLAGGGAVQSMGVEGVSDVILGPKGTKLRFSIQVHPELAMSDFYFDTVGYTTSASTYGTSMKVLDTTVRIEGLKTGYKLEVPIKFIKKPLT